MKFNKWKRDDGYILFFSFFFVFRFGLLSLCASISGCFCWDFRMGSFFV
jgi:hypothetical protein